jgi:hypothetical protein
MGMVILLFGFFGIALGTGWVAQLLLGKGRRVNWTQAFWVGLAGMGVAVLLAWLVDRDRGTTFGGVGFLVAIAAAFVIQWIVGGREAKEEAVERQHRRELTPEGLPGHHQPQHHPKRKKRRR